MPSTTQHLRIPDNQLSSVVAIEAIIVWGASDRMAIFEQSYPSKLSRDET